MRILKLFNSVLQKESSEDAFVSEVGYVIEPGVLWAKNEIIRYFQKENLDGYGLNKTFHKIMEQDFKKFSG